MKPKFSVLHKENMVLINLNKWNPLQIQNFVEFSNFNWKVWIF